MSEIEQVTSAIFGDTPMRTGYSDSVDASYVVAADLKGAMKYNSTVNAFLRGIEKDQTEDAPYVGMEGVETPGGMQRMKVVYKRGVFQLLMTSRKPEATKYRDRVFDVLEKIERHGYYLKDNATLNQLQEMQAELDDRERRIDGIVAGAQRAQDNTDREVKLQLDSERRKREETQYQLALSEAYNRYLEDFTVHCSSRDAMTKKQFEKGRF